MDLIEAHKTIFLNGESPTLKYTIGVGDDLFQYFLLRGEWGK